MSFAIFDGFYYMAKSKIHVAKKYVDGQIILIVDGLPLKKIIWPSSHTASKCDIAQTIRLVSKSTKMCIKRFEVNLPIELLSFM